MIYFLALLPATGLTIAGYFVLYLSSRSEGSLRTFGRYLGFWAFTLAGLVILGTLFAAAHYGHRASHHGMYGMHERMHGPWPGGPRFFEHGMPEREESAPGSATQPTAPSPPAQESQPAGAPATPPVTH